jgi:hypothetical protein
MDRKGLGDADAAREALLGKSADNSGTGRGAILQDSESEFGDDDLDQDFMDLADTAADPFVTTAGDHNEFDSLGSSAWSNLAAEKLESNHSRLQSMSDKKPPAAHNFMNNETKPDDSDEFEDDYGVFDNDFEDALVKCDTKPTNALNLPIAESQPARKVDAVSVDLVPQVSAHVPQISAHVATTLSDDEFDDEFDLDAIEQTMKQNGEDAAYVGHS